MSKNLYSLLGVSKNASTEEIKKAYRKKALRCHPDRTSALPETARKLAEEEFKQINNAHQTLTDDKLRQRYDRGDVNYSYADQPDTTYTYPAGSDEFTSSARNGRVNLTGASKSEWTVHNGYCQNQTYKVTLEIAKNSLDPVLEHLNELVEALNNRAFNLDNNNHPLVINKKYEKVATQMNAMYYQIMSNIDSLRDNVVDYEEMLRVLRASQCVMKEAQNDGEFGTHRSFVRNCPVLRELCVCLDVMANSFTFLDKKIGKTISGDQSPVFASMQAFRHGMFKPMHTSTMHKVDELNTDITWYIKEIEEAYNSSLLYGH